jgi:hypothetical protein
MVVWQLFPIVHWTVVAVEGAILKLGVGMVTVIVVLWDKDPMVPVTFTKYVFGATVLDAVMVMVDVPDPPVMLGCVNVPDRPAGRDIDN